jgi:hypothetical protein
LVNAVPVFVTKHVEFDPDAPEDLFANGASHLLCSLAFTNGCVFTETDIGKRFLTFFSSKWWQTGRLVVRAAPSKDSFDEAGQILNNEMS